MADLVFTRLPVPDGTSISGTFGQTEGFPHPHRGVDYEVGPNTPIIAPADGVVVNFGNDGSFGIGVCLDHVDTPFFSLYAHLNQALVEIGQQVRTGDVIGLSGDTGKVTGPHLHWQVCRVSAFPPDISQSADPLSFVRRDDGRGVVTRRTGNRAPMLTVVGTQGCLNVRAAPSVQAISFGCFPDGTTFAGRGLSQENEGRLWIGVVGPNGEEAWAAAEFLA